MPDPRVESLRDATAEGWLELAASMDGCEDADVVCVTHNHRRFRVNVSRDNLAGPRNEPDLRWHLSVSDMGQPAHPPRWSDFVTVVHAVRPGVIFCTALPPRSMWMNLHPGVLHAFEIKDPNLIDHWRSSGREAKRLGVGVPT